MHFDKLLFLAFLERASKSSLDEMSGKFPDFLIPLGFIGFCFREFVEMLHYISRRVDCSGGGRIEPGFGNCGPSFISDTAIICREGRIDQEGFLIPDGGGFRFGIVSDTP